MVINMRKRIRFISVMSCITIVLSIVLSTSFIIIFSDHECTGNDCEICHHMQFCEQTFEKLALGSIILPAVITIGAASGFTMIASQNILLSDTLVSMKIKLSC